MKLSKSRIDSINSQKVFIDSHPLLSQHHHPSDHPEEELLAVQVKLLLPDGNICG